MKPEDEQLFFGHDLATPFTNLRGSHFLLKMALKTPGPDALEALDILDANSHFLERMLGWYWRIREIEGQLQPAAPYPSQEVLARVNQRIADEAIALRPPMPAAMEGRIQIPLDPLVTGLLGAAITLRSASESEAAWTFEAGDGVVWSRYSLEGDEYALDPSRLFRKVYWPSRTKVNGWSDPCLPYLRAVLEPFGGGLELTWEEGRWELAASVPLVP